jgi:DNA-binding transcriptional regulator GbsR (MarR family)
MSPPIDNFQTEPYSASFLKARDEFIHLWGEMGAHWGISKTMSQIFALLYITPHPMDTDAIMEVLFISRGNAHINLKKLIDWGLAYKLEKMDVRRDYYSVEKNIWMLCILIIKHRQLKEIAPIETVLRQLIRTLQPLQDEPDAKFTASADELEMILQIENTLFMIEKLNLLVEKLLPILAQKDEKRLDEILKKLE